LEANASILTSLEILQLPEVSVVYVNYNTFDLLRDSVESLEKHSSMPFEIIVVDNNSGDIERNMLEEWLSIKAVKNVRLIFSDMNMGFAAANNLAAEHATSKYLFFLNPDTLVMNDVVSLFCNFMERSEPSVAACGAYLLNGDHAPTSSYGNFPGLLLELCNVGLGLSWLLSGYYKKHIAIGSAMWSRRILQVPYIVGADIFIRSEAFKTVGKFDENFFMYYEETDLFFRLRKSRLRSYILPEARIVHLEGGAVGQSSADVFNYNKYEMILTSKLYYYKKWHAKILPAIKGLIRMQITVQYFKGKWGNDLRRLSTIYARIVHEKGGAS